VMEMARRWVIGGWGVRCRCGRLRPATPSTAGSPPPP
jgi:hypothetical protein